MELILKNKMGSGYPMASGTVEVDPASGAVYSHAHKFERNNYTTPTYCDVCHSLLWGPRTGLKCYDCGFNVHERCREKAPKTCTKFKAAIAKAITTDDIEQLPVDVHRSSLDLDNDHFNFPRNPDDNSDSQIIMQGYLYKQVSVFL